MRANRGFTDQLWPLVCVLALVGCGEDTRLAIGTDETGTLRFVDTTMGSTERTQAVVWSNRMLSNIRVEQVSGEPITIGDVGFDGGVSGLFTLSRLPSELNGSAFFGLVATFTPPLTPETPERSYEGTVRAVGRSDLGAHVSATLTLRGRAYLNDPCPVPPLDFGNVQAGTIATREVRLRNRHDEPVTFWVGPFSPPGELSFEPGSPQGSFTLPPRAERSLFIRYAPRIPSVSVTAIGISESRCAARTLNIKAAAVSSCVVPNCELGDVNHCDFGTLAPGTTSDARVALKNVCSDPVQVTSLVADGPGFSVIGPRTFTVPSSDAGTVETLVHFAPTSPGEKVGTLSITSSSRAPLTLTLRGAMSAPDAGP